MRDQLSGRIACVGMVSLDSCFWPSSFSVSPSQSPRKNARQARRQKEWPGVDEAVVDSTQGGWCGGDGEVCSQDGLSVEESI